TDGRLTIDNGPAEQAIRSLAVGRKNWLHLGGDGALRPTAVLLSITASIKRRGLDPWAYLKHVLTQLPARPAGTDLADLLPDQWARSTAGPVTVPGCSSPAEPQGPPRGESPAPEPGGAGSLRATRGRGRPHRRSSRSPWPGGWCFPSSGRGARPLRPPRTDCRRCRLVGGSGGQEACAIQPASKRAAHPHERVRGPVRACFGVS